MSLLSEYLPAEPVHEHFTDANASCSPAKKCDSDVQATDHAGDLSNWPSQDFFNWLSHSDSDETSPAARSGAFPKIQAFNSFLDEPMERPSELISGLLFQGMKMVVAGGSKSFKTWVLADLAVSVASGSQWLGCDTIQGDVLFINLEIPKYFMRDRFNKILRAKGVSCPINKLDVLNLRGFSTGIHELLPQIEAQLNGEKQYSLTICDPIYKVYGNLVENAAEDMAQLMNRLERYAVETGSAVAFGAHFSKGNQSLKDPIDRIAGSGVFGRDPDTLLLLTQHKNPDSFAVESTLRLHKPKASFVISWNFPMMQLRPDLNPEDLKQIKKPHTKRVRTKEEVTPHIPCNGTISQTLLRSKLTTAEIPKERQKELIAELIADGDIFEWKVGRSGTGPEIFYSRKPQPPPELPLGVSQEKKTKIRKKK